MSKLKQKKYIASILIMVIVLGIIGLFSYGKVDKYKGQIKVGKAKLLGSVVDTGLVTSKGTEEVKYNLTYTLDPVEGLERRDVVIKGKLNSPYARFKEINKSNITSTLINDGQEIEINIEDVRLGEQKELELIIKVLNAPNKEEITPEISIKEKTGEETRVSGNPIKVETNSIEGIVLDENNLPVSNIELSINKNGREIKRTYTSVEGNYVFSDLEEGEYIIKVEEDIYEIESGEKVTPGDENNKIKVKQVDKYNVETKKYIEKLDLVVNGKENHYTYKDSEKVIQNVKNAKRISGKIEYKIVVRNKSDKQVEIDELEDKPGEGLEFKESENTGWKNKNGKIVYELMEGVSLRGKEKREIKLVLSINDTNEIKTYINKMTSRGEIKEKVVFVIDNKIKREIEVTEGTVIERPDFDIEDLDGWYTDSNYTNKYKFSNRVNKDLILYARTNEEKPKYQVRYIDKNEVIKTEEVEEGNKTSAPSDPSKRGYTFNCWKKGKSCFNFDTPIEEDIDLISDYNIITYNVTYNLQGGTVTGNPGSYTVETNPFTLVNPTKEGYTFIGWTGSNGDTPELTVTLPEDELGDKNYTANYSINRYELEIDPKGGSYPGELLIEGDYGEIITISEPTKEGYNFTGWTLSGKGTYNNGIYTFGEGNGKLEANYSPIEYTITYKEITDEERILLNNPVTYSVETNEFTLNNPADRLDGDGKGEVFVGWKEKNTETPSMVITLPDRNNLGNKEYTAVWQEREADRWNITYDFDGATTIPTNPSSYVRSDLPITLNNPTKTGYEFTGWTGSNGETPSAHVVIPQGTEEDLSYKANFTLNNYTITYDYTSCNLTPVEITTLNNRGSYTVLDDNFSLNNPNKYGYKFTGWSGTDLEEKTLNVLVDTNKAKDLSYKANCELEKYDVEFYNYVPNSEYSLVKTVEDIEYNTLIPTSEIPSVSLRGYTFKYWSLDKTTEYNLSTPITENTKLYAVYQKDTYNITYELDGGTVTGNPDSYQVDTEAFTLNEPSKTGYNFIGWTGSCGDNPLKVVTLPEEELGDKNYIANYEKEKYIVTYMNGETKHDEEEVEYNEKATGNVETPTKAHNIFTGWTLNENPYDFNTPVISNITLYALFEEVEAPTITHTPTTWVRDKVLVTISSEHNDYTYMYKIGNGTYQSYSEPFEIDENTTVYAYSVKNDISSVETSHEINNIDKINPSINSLEEIGKTPTSVTIKTKFRDLESGSNILKIYLDNELVFESPTYTEDVTEEKEIEYTVGNLEQITTYTIKAEILDKVGNISSEEIEVTTPEKHYVARTLDEDGVEIKKYETLKEAIESSECVNICRIEMLDNVEETNSVLDGQDIKLDLNGFTITGLQDKVFENNGILQIVDYNEEEVGKVYSSGTAIINTGKLIIGENEEELVVSKTEPVIEGLVTGINSPGELHFYDGKIIGGSTTGALKGSAPITPYSYNASVETSGDKEIVTLEIIAEAEARINSVYYTKVQEAVDASKNGSYVTPEGTTSIVESVQSKSDYRFVPDIENGTLTSNNQNVANSVAASYIYIDTRNSECDRVLSFTGTISSGSGDYGYVHLTNSSKTPTYNQEANRLMYMNGNGSTDNINVLLEKGKEYYLHFGYIKDQYYTSYQDQFVISDLKLYDYVIDEENDMLDNIISDSEYHFKKQSNNTYINNNSNMNNNKAYSYIKIDMTNKSSEEILYLDASFTTSYNIDYGYVAVTNSKGVPNRDDESVQLVLNSENIARQLYEIKLIPNEVNYVYFCHDRGSGYENWGFNFTLYSLKLQKYVDKEIMNSDITKNGTYFMHRTDAEPRIWKDLVGNNNGIISNCVWDEENHGLTFNGTNSYVSLPEINPTELTVRAKFMIHQYQSQFVIGNYEAGGYAIYVNASKQLVGGVYVNGGYKEIKVANTQLDTLYDVTLTYDEQQVNLYVNGVRQTPIDSAGSIVPPSKNTHLMLGTNPVRNESNSQFLNGTIYDIKVYDKAQTADEVNSESTDQMIIHLDGTNHKSMLDKEVFINNNQGVGGTYASSYMMFDLTNLGNKKIIINAEVSSEPNNDYGYVRVTDGTSAVPWDSSNRYVFISGEVDAQDYEIPLTGGKVNYVHIGYNKNGSIDQGKDTFKVNYVKYYEDSDETIPVYIISNPTTEKSKNIEPELNQDPDTVQILRNITMTKPLEIVETRNVVLDLNGYQLTTSKDDYVINNEGSLKIIDTDFDNQEEAAREKYAREQQEFVDEYNTKIQEQEEFYTNKQAEYDQEYNDKKDELNRIHEEEEERFNELAEEFLDYMNSDEYNPDVYKEYDYTGQENVFVVPKTGTYKLETWGAQGAGYNDTYHGGYGSYSVGEAYLRKGQTLYINVGGAGVEVPNNDTREGGYNGGGSVPLTWTDGNERRRTGGGATHIATKSGLLSSLEDNKEDVLIVSGGGGAAQVNAAILGSAHSVGGSAGGSIGEPGVGSEYTPGSGGSQDTPGTEGSGGTAGSFGQGGSCTTWGNCSGGGGGYYGGGASFRGSGGGSGYIKGLTNAKMVMYSTDSSYEKDDADDKTIVTTNLSENPVPNYAKKGNGYAIIKFIESDPDASDSEYTIDDAKNEIQSFIRNYDYVGNYQTFTAPITANYKVQAWGASGGYAVCNGSKCGTPGNGGYSQGTIHLNKGDEIYIYVGQKGSDAVSGSNTSRSFNGGGLGTSDGSDDEAAGAGGGATDIRLISSDWDNTSSLASRIMVAGAGGGASWSDYSAGSGGGLSGNDNSSGLSKGATQTTGYAFGIGKDGEGTGDSNGVAGGGGGYFGGESHDFKGGEPGSGGSGYISGYTGSVAIQSEDNTNPKYGCDNGTEDVECSYHYSGKVFTDPIIKSGTDVMPDYRGESTIRGNEGNGFVKITLADSIVSDPFEEKEINVETIQSNFVAVNASAYNLTDGKPTIHRSYSDTQAALYYKDLITVSSLDTKYDLSRLKGSVSCWNDWSEVTSLGTLYVGYSTSNENRTDDFVSYDTFEVSGSANNKRNYNFDLSTPTEPGDYYFKIVLYHNSNTSSYTVVSMINSLTIFKKINRKDASEKILENASDIYSVDDYISDNLIIKYDGLNHGSINGVWKDLGSYNNDGTITGASYDEKTGGFIFNGNNYVSSKKFDEDEFTWEVSFKPNSISGCIMANYENGGLGIDMAENKLRAQVFIDGAYRNLYSIDNLVPGTNYIASVTYKDGTATLYLNGVEQSSYSGTTFGYATNNTIIMLGANPGGTSPQGSYYNGLIYGARIYNKALKTSDIVNNFNVDISRYNFDYEIVKKVPVMDSTSQNGNITSTTYSTIKNNEGAYLDIDEAKIYIDKEGGYNAIDNYGSLTIGDKGYVYANKRYNNTIFNHFYGDILDGTGTLTNSAPTDAVANIYNQSKVDTGFGGYKFVNVNTNTRGLINVGTSDMVLNDINSTGSGIDIYQNSNNELVINNSLLNSTAHHSIYGNPGTTGKITINDSTINNRIYNENGSFRDIEVNNSDFHEKNVSYYSIYNISGKVELNNDTTDACNRIFMYNPDVYARNGRPEATINNLTMNIQSTCNSDSNPKIINDNATMTINDMNLSSEVQTDNSNDWTLVRNTNGIMNLNNSTIKRTTGNMYRAIYNNGNGTINVKDGEISGFELGVTNVDTAKLVLGEDDNEVSTTSPKIQANTTAINGNVNSPLEFYDGVIIGKKGEALKNTVSAMPDNYDMHVDFDDETEEITLKPKDSTLEKHAVCRIGDTKYTSIQNAVDSISTSDMTEIVVIADIYTGDQVVIPEGKHVKLNYNGHFVRSYSSPTYITNNGTLQIMDDSGSVKESDSYSSEYIKNNSILEYNNIKLNSIYIDNILLNLGGTSNTINGGDLKGQGKVLTNSSRLDIYGGSFEKTTNNNSYDLITNAETGVIEVHDGRFKNTGTNYNVSIFRNNNDLIIHNGTFIAYKVYVVINNTPGTLIIDGGTFDNSIELTVWDSYDGSIVYNAGDATITTIETNYSNCARNSGTLRVNDSKFTDIRGNAFYNTSGTITTSDSEVNLNGGRVFYLERGTATLDNYNVTGSSSERNYLNGGSNVTVSNSNFEINDYYGNNMFEVFGGSTLNLIDNNIYHNNTTYSWGRSPMIQLYDGSTLNVKSGTYKSEYLGVIYTDRAGVNITIGEEGGVPSKTDPKIEGQSYGVTNNNLSSYLNFYDGVIIGQTAIVGKVNDIEDGYDIILDTTDDIEHKYLDRLPLVKNIDRDIDYFDLDTAFAEVEDNETLELQREVTLIDSTPTITNTKNVTFDLNGNKLIQNNAKLIINNGTLTLKDSKATDPETFLADKGMIESFGSTIVENNGTLNIISGDYHTKENTLVENNGTLVISNGYFYKSDTSKVTNNLFVNNSTGSVQIDGGHFVHNGSRNSLFYNEGTVVINDGQYNMTGTNNDNPTYVIKNMTQNSEIHILGGSYPHQGWASLLFNEGTAEVKDISIYYGHFIENKATGDLTIKNVVDDPTRYLQNGLHSYGNLYMENYQGNSRGIFIYGTATIKDSVSTGMSVDGYDSYNGLHLLGSSNTTIDNYNISGPRNLVDISDSANLTIKNCDILATSGSTSWEKGVFVLRHQGSGTLTIESGKIKSTNNQYCTEGIRNTGSGTINIGIKDVVVSTTSPEISAINYGLINTNSSSTINFYDGIISGKTAMEGIISEIEPNYHIITDVNDDIESKYLDNKELVENIDTGIKYQDLSSAFADVQDNETLKILGEITTLPSDTTINNSKIVTLDLNGYKIVQNFEGLIKNTGSLTIDDTSTSGSGSILANKNKIVENDGILIINKGKYYTNYTELSNLFINNQNGTMTVNDGEISIDMYTVINNAGTLNINGGSIHSRRVHTDRGATGGGNNLIENTGDMNVTSGTFKYIGDGGIINNTGTLTVTGGSFSHSGHYWYSYGSNYSLGYAFINRAGATATISGGTYPSSQAKIMYNYGNATISDITTNAYAQFVTNTSTGVMELNNNTITGHGVYNLYAEEVLISNTGTLNVINGTYDGIAALYNKDNGTVEITGTTLNAMSINGNSNTTIHSATILPTGGYDGIVTNQNATLTIENINIHKDSSASGGYPIHLTQSWSGSVNTTSIEKGTIISEIGNAIFIEGSTTLNVGKQGGTPSITEPSIIGKTYGIYKNSNSSDLYLYDGSIKGETGSIYGTISDVEPGYKEKRDNITDPDLGITYVESTLTVVGDTERIAMVGTVNFLSLQSAVNYASNNGIENIQLFKSVILEDNLVLPAGGSTVKIHLNGNTITQGSYTIDSGITLDSGIAPGASVARFLANISGQEINPRNIVIYELEDGSSLDANNTYKLYKEIGGELKIVKVKENEIGDYDLGYDKEILRTTRSRIYINGIGEGTYKLVGSDSKEITFTIYHDGVSSNIRENNNINGNRVSTAIATLILSLQTGMVRNPYILIIMILIVGILGFIALKKNQEYKNIEEDYEK